MPCSCVLVVSDRGAIPEVLGDAGIDTDPQNAQDVARGIRPAMTTPPTCNACADQNCYLVPYGMRRYIFLSLFEDLLA